MKKKVILSAFNVHTGGGLVLLKSLIDTKLLKIKLLDLRVKEKIKLNKSENNIYVKKSILSRLYYFHKVCFKSKNDEKIICFNGLPPLFKTKAHVVLFIQTFYFFADISNFNFNLYTFLRIQFEKFWFVLGISNADEIWVQTETMKKRLNIYLKSRKIKKKFIIKKMPLLDNETNKLYLKLRKSTYKKNKENNAINSNNFFYPADGAGHKNHERLINAFAEIKKDYKLYLTLDNSNFLRIIGRSQLDKVKRKNIINLGYLSRKKIFQIYKNKIGTLIFPSLDESFGIPLIEAYMFKKHIVTSDVKYSRDILANFYKFNPYSTKAIKNCLNKYLNSKQKKKIFLKDIKFVTPKNFINGKEFN